jgi:hypothetical protein
MVTVFSASESLTGLAVLFGILEVTSSRWLGRDLDGLREAKDHVGDRYANI